MLCRTVCDTDLDAVAGFCPLMEQLDILGTREVSPGAVQRYLITSHIQCSLVTVNKRAALVQWYRPSVLSDLQCSDLQCFDAVGWAAGRASGL